MEAKAGDRVALDAKKVGQPKRTGVISRVAKGLSGLRYTVSWDDGTTSIISPSLGNLTVETGKRPKAANGKPTGKKSQKAKPKRAKR
jgi:hypothetical protein